MLGEGKDGKKVLPISKNISTGGVEVLAPDLTRHPGVE